MNAALILLSFGVAALDDANPYKASPNQSGFATFGARVHHHMMGATSDPINAKLLKSHAVAEGFNSRENI